MPLDTGLKSGYVLVCRGTMYKYRGKKCLANCKPNDRIYCYSGGVYEVISNTKGVLDNFMVIGRKIDDRRTYPFDKYNANHIMKIEKYRPL